MDIKEKNITIQGEYPIGTTITYDDEKKKSPAVVIIMEQESLTVTEMVSDSIPIYTKVWLRHLRNVAIYPPVMTSAEHTLQVVVSTVQDFQT